MPKLRFFVPVVFTFISAAATANCYIIYDNSGKMTYQSSQPPVDLSKSISHEMATRYKSRHLVILSEAKGCADLGERAESGSSSAKPEENRRTVIADVDRVLEKSPLFRKRITFLGDDH